LAGCVLADAMPSALDQIARAAGGDGAVLVRSRNDMAVTATTSAHILEPVTAYIAGDRPNDRRIQKVRPGLAEGFRLDQDDFSFRQIARDPYYQEFLRPRGFGWHACALLAELPGGDLIHLSIKRRADRGAFSREDVAHVGAQLPLLRAALKFTQTSAPTALWFGRSFSDTRRFMIGFNARGEAFDIDSALGERDVLAVRDGALIWAERKDQAILDAALARALGNGMPVAEILTAPDGTRWSFRMRRWSDPDGPVAFVAMVSALDYVHEPSAEWLGITQSLFGLTYAEARVAALIGQGVSVTEVAVRLALSTGTVRNQLKAVFAKTRAKRQTELSVLLSRI
jgi:DNA-binding CsgD family transcriptional regulator